MIILDLSYLQRNQAVSQTEEKDFYIRFETMAVTSSHSLCPELTGQATMPSNKYILKTLGSYLDFTIPIVTSCKSNPFGHIEYTPYPDTYVPYLRLLFHSHHLSYFFFYVHWYLHNIYGFFPEKTGRSTQVGICNLLSDRTPAPTHCLAHSQLSINCTVRVNLNAV